MAKKYDIIIHDEDPQVKPEKQTGLIANSPQELIGMFKACGQDIEILREYEDDESKNYGKNTITDYSNIKLDSGGVISEDGTKIMDGGGFMKMNPNLPQYNPSTNNIKSTNNVQYVKSEPPRYFEIGGIKCKMENGKMYQKQWMRLNDTEASEFRIVSDKNNKICPIKDKHIEVMKWVLVEDDNVNNSNEENKLELING